MDFNALDGVVCKQNWKPQAGGSQEPVLEKSRKLEEQPRL